MSWNTWDVDTHTGMVHLPSMRRIRFGVPGAGGYTWRDGLVRLGPHTPDGSYAEVTVEGLHLELAGGDGDTLHVRATGPAIEVVVDRWRSTEDSTTLEFAGTVDLVVTPDGQREADVSAVLAERRAAAEAGSVRSSGWLGDAAAAATRAVTWNTIYAPDLDRVLTPTSRDFVSRQRKGFYGTWALHAWDTFFTGLVATLVDRDQARAILTQILPFASPSGMIPNRISDDRGATEDRSQPPVGGLTVLKAYLASGLSTATRDRRLLAQTFPALLAWHDWWPRHRRGPHGLLAWGSDPVDGDDHSGTLDAAKRESGLDDSPMYDAAAYDPVTHTMDLADAGLAALHVADGQALARMADLLGETQVAQRLRVEAADAATAASVLWTDNGYRNLRADGTHDPHVSPTLLYPLLAGMPTQAQAARVAELLLRAETLGGDPPLPSVARDDPGYEATYWRGRIWAPMAYLAIEGLRRYDHDTRPLTSALLRLFLDEWDRHSHVRENYPATVGEDVRALKKRSDGLMAWGGLLACLAFGELADPRPDGWRFAHPGEPAELANLPLGDGRLTVTAADRLTVTLDGVVLIDAAPDAVITAYQYTPAEVSGHARGEVRVRALGGALVPVDPGPFQFVN